MLSRDKDLDASLSFGNEVLKVEPNNFLAFL